MLFERLILLDPTFGSILKGRVLVDFKDFRYGFGNQEKDDEVSGAGNTTTATFWEYDTRLGRRWNLDPEPLQFISGYTCFSDNPISFTDVLGNKIHYGTDNESKENKKRIKAEVKDRMRSDAQFKTQVKAWKRDNNINVVFQDMAETSIDNGTKSTVTGATVFQGVLTTGSGAKDKNFYYVWNINLIKLPDEIPFMSGESFVENKQEQNENYKKTIEINNGSMPVNFHRFINDPLKNQIGLWLSANKNSNLIIQVGGDLNNEGWTDSQDGQLLSSRELAQSRKRVIQSALKTVPFVDWNRIDIKIVNDPAEKTKLIKHD